jgi:hypothetical protein
MGEHEKQLRMFNWSQEEKDMLIQGDLRGIMSPME